MDTPESDDGVLHAVFKALSVADISKIMATLRYLSTVRGPVTPDHRALAIFLATDAAFPLDEHPVVRRILEAP
jgi:hypothetical protein